MEQTPPPPPGGQNFGQPPYAAPPPRQATSPWMYCLGCMGILAILAVIGIFVMVNRIKKAMGPPITAATVQQALPPGVPIYPGAVILTDQSRSIRLPSKGPARSMTALSFETKDAIGVIGPWYQARLTPQGWVGGASATDANVYQFKKGDTAMSLQSRPWNNGQNLLTMSIVEGVPAGSVGTPTGP